MDVKSCRNCGKLFNYLQGPPICPMCRKKLEDKFEEVREFVRDNETATMTEISETMDVSVKQIRQWVREERLTFTENSPVGIECEGCGTMIRTGRYCDKCKNNLSNTLKQMYASPKKEVSVGIRGRDKDRMRYLDK